MQKVLCFLPLSDKRIGNCVRLRSSRSKVQRCQRMAKSDGRSLIARFHTHTQTLYRQTIFALFACHKVYTRGNRAMFRGAPKIFLFAIQRK